DNIGREAAHKKAVVVTARVHPGETNSSWVMEGFLDFLLGDSEDAQVLRDNFVFKVEKGLTPFPVCGTTSGTPLLCNYALKSAPRLRAEMEVLLYCDFHGHNRKNNAFMYGCIPPEQVRASSFLSPPKDENISLPSQFSFQSCKFRVQRSKEGTGRIFMWRLGIQNSYTMETSFGGSTLAPEVSEAEEPEAIRQKDKEPPANSEHCKFDWTEAVSCFLGMRPIPRQEFDLHGPPVRERSRTELDPSRPEFDLRGPTVRERSRTGPDPSRQESDLRGPTIRERSRTGPDPSWQESDLRGPTVRERSRRWQV
uniref:Peptidase M14 domain-containing protein n=1 Tax=Oryzias melastigma TaxID=30732 RepID=A0A3B3CUA3_ORYME